MLLGLIMGEGSEKWFRFGFQCYDGIVYLLLSGLGGFGVRFSGLVGGVGWMGCVWEYLFAAIVCFALASDCLFGASLYVVQFVSFLLFVNEISE